MSTKAKEEAVMRLAPIAWLAVSIGCMLISMVLFVFSVRNVFLTILIGVAAISIFVWATRFLISRR